jgi:hypothetical protein
MADTFILPANDPQLRETRIGNLVRFLRLLPANCAWAVETKKHKRRRSDPQNRYLNGVAYKILAQATGYERDDISEYLCGQYFGWKEKRVPGKRVVQVPIRTTTTNEDGRYAPLNTSEFAEYVAFVQRFGAEHGVYIPDPNEEYQHAA